MNLLNTELNLSCSNAAKDVKDGLQGKLIQNPSIQLLSFLYKVFFFLQKYLIKVYWNSNTLKKQSTALW